MKVKTTIDVPEQRLRDMLTCAFEGGSNYWYLIDESETVYADGLSYEDFKEGGKLTDPDNYHHPLEIIPFTKGCSLHIRDKNDNGCWGYFLGLAELEAGLQVMAEKYPRHFSDMLEENDDADTGDVYLQCCLFGEVIFG